MAFLSNSLEKLNDDNIRATTNPSWVNPNDNEFASKTMANIERERFDDYMERYPAIHEEYLDMTMEPDFTLEQVDRVEGNVASSFASADEQRKATLARMGVEDTAPTSSLAQSLSVAHGENSVRQHGEDRQLATLSGSSLPNLQTQAT